MIIWFGFAPHVDDTTTRGCAVRVGSATVGRRAGGLDHRWRGSSAKAEYVREVGRFVSDGSIDTAGEDKPSTIYENRAAINLPWIPCIWQREWTMKGRDKFERGVRSAPGALSILDLLSTPF